MLGVAMENEVEEFVQKYSELTDENGRKAVVRNGYMRQRNIVTGMGPLTTGQPRVDDRSLNEC